ncbi:GntR family transcriptional regulator [Plantibacter sp. YIM 135249]|uniref:GntR family transcriptional regulator n=1 Tax=Plantibacter sp. YIM 135249 TaxID=3423918 RepID=UPI003D337C37
MPVPSVVARTGPRRTMRDEVYDKLLQAIYMGEVAPGERLVDADIETLTGASRTPIREAIAKLVEVGFVEVSPQSVTRVAPLDLAWLRGCVQLMGWMFADIVAKVSDELTDEDLADIRAGFSSGVQASSWAEVLESPDPRGESLGVLVRRKGNASYAAFEGIYSPHIGRALNLHPELLPLSAMQPAVESFLAALEAKDAALASAEIESIFTVVFGGFLDRLDTKLAEQDES